MLRAATLATAFMLVALTVLPARAQLGATGTRLSVAGGAPRFYMTYGHIEERELFAPITIELKRLKLMFLVEGDTCKVLHRGEKIATWPVARSRDDIPDSLDQPFILVLGSTTYVPVKRLSKLAPIDLKWDRTNNTVAVVAGKTKTAVVPTIPRPTPKPAPNAQPAPKAPDTSPGAPAADHVVLTGITLEEAGAGFRVRVQTSGSVRPSTLYLAKPPRVVIDFPGARWADGLPVPQGTGSIRNIRVGHPTPDQARLVLETTTLEVKVTATETAASQTVLSLGGGTVVAKKPVRPKTTPAPSALEEKVRAAVARRGKTAAVRLAQSRGGRRLQASNSATLTVEPTEVPASNAWQYIVIHHSATPSGNAAAFDAMHRRKKWDGLAYHFVINNGKGNPDGHLEISPRWSEQKHGAHAGGLPGGTHPDVRNGFNEFGIGICLVGNFQRSRPTEKQLRTLALLIQELREEFNIPAENVLGHGSVKGTACPGAAFPWARLFALMELPAPKHLHRHAILQTTARCPWCQVKEAEK